MPNPKPIVAVLLAVFLSPLYASTVHNVSLIATAQSGEVPGDAGAALRGLQRVGEATLRVFIWDVYDSTLYTSDGNFQGIGPQLALNIRYKRAVTSEQLVRATAREWKKLALYEGERCDAWLEALRQLWPNIAAQDEILLYVDSNLASHFFYNGQRIGVMPDPEFTRQFLAIWLSPDTSHPKVRAKLLNLSHSFSDNYPQVAHQDYE